MTGNYSRHDLSDHLINSLATYVDCVRNPPRGISKLQPETYDAMRALLPAGVVRESHVLLQDGAGVPEHDHPEYVALWYADPGSPVHPVVIEGESVYPKAGECIVMSPYVVHHVDPYESNHPRVLFAVLVLE